MMHLRRPFYLLFMAVVYLHAALAMATTGDTAQDDIAREFGGSPRPINDGAAPPPPPAGCNTTLQQEQAAGQIPANESCYCPVGATTPTCVVNTNSECQSVLQAEQSRMGASYDCTCPSGASTPSCVSYYQLCENNLPYYQNGTNQCSCSQGTTSAVPSCVSDYQICENNAAQYENSNTTCSCSQTSTSPTCCTSTTTQNCSTTQQCTTTQQCQQVATGWSCPATYNGVPFFSMECRGINSEVHQTNEPLSYCTTQTPDCLYSTGYYLYVISAGTTYGQQCTPVTTCTPVQTCTPVTTQSCITEP